MVALITAACSNLNIYGVGIIAITSIGLVANAAGGNSILLFILFHNDFVPPIFSKEQSSGWARTICAFTDAQCVLWGLFSCGLGIENGTA